MNGSVAQLVSAHIAEQVAGSALAPLAGGGRWMGRWADGMRLRGRWERQMAQISPAKPA